MTTTIGDVISEARERGLRNLPEPTHLSHVRVWPASDSLWVAEVGEPPHNKVIGPDMYPTKDDATAAGVAYVTERRSALVTALPDDLADVVRSWPEPTVDHWDG